MAKRRDVLKAGAMAVASTPAIFGGAALPRVAQAQLCRPEGVRSPLTEPDSFTDPTTLQGPHPEIPPGSPANEPPFTNPENTVAGHDNVFPINRGGAEEFLQPTPRNKEDPDNGPPQMGSGCFFTFGRNHGWPNAGGPWGGIVVPPVAADGTPGLHKVDITYNFDPSRRLRIYQFDPLHHDVAVYSLH